MSFQRPHCTVPIAYLMICVFDSIFSTIRNLHTCSITTVPPRSVSILHLPLFHYTDSTKRGEYTEKRSYILWWRVHEEKLADVNYTLALQHLWGLNGRAGWDEERVVGVSTQQHFVSCQISYHITTTRFIFLLASDGGWAWSYSQSNAPFSRDLLLIEWFSESFFRWSFSRLIFRNSPILSSFCFLLSPFSFQIL